MAPELAMMISMAGSKNIRLFIFMMIGATIGKLKLLSDLTMVLVQSVVIRGTQLMPQVEMQQHQSSTRPSYLVLLCLMLPVARYTRTEPI